VYLSKQDQLAQASKSTRNKFSNKDLAIIIIIINKINIKF
jgi:hypothetical protein